MYYETLVAMGATANDLVFEQGSRLHEQIDVENHRISSGNGAWIMKKCAKTMGSSCRIQFEPNETIFTFVCPASAIQVSQGQDSKNFKAPAGTWGVVVNDSKIQQRHMFRLLAYAGVDPKRRVILGGDPEEVRGLERTMTNILDSHPTSTHFDG